MTKAEKEGFEPAKHAYNVFASHKKEGVYILQSDVFYFEKWWGQRDLNPRPRRYERPALTAELCPQKEIFCTLGILKRGRKPADPYRDCPDSNSSEDTAGLSTDEAGASTFGVDAKSGAPPPFLSMSASFVILGASSDFA